MLLSADFKAEYVGTDTNGLNEHIFNLTSNICNDVTSLNSDPQFRLRLSSKLPYWPNYDNSGPIAYAEMNQMYERVGIRLERSSSSNLSDMVSSPTSTPPCVFDDSDADDFDCDDNNGVEEGIVSNYFDIYAKEARCENGDNDHEVIEKSPYLSSHTDNSGINSDVPTINTRCRSQSQSSCTMVSVTGDAHLIRLRQVRYFLVLVLVLVLVFGRHVPLLFHMFK